MDAVAGGANAERSLLVVRFGIERRAGVHHPLALSLSTHARADHSPESAPKQPIRAQAPPPRARYAYDSIPTPATWQQRRTGSFQYSCRYFWISGGVTGRSAGTSGCTHALAVSPFTSYVLPACTPSTTPNPRPIPVSARPRPMACTSVRVPATAVEPDRSALAWPSFSPAVVHSDHHRTGRRARRTVCDQPWHAAEISPLIFL